VALKEERELSLQVIAGNQQGSECRPELRCRGRIPPVRLKTIGNTWEDDLSPSCQKKFLLKISGPFERKDPRVHFANMGHCSALRAFPGNDAASRCSCNQVKHLVKVQVEALWISLKDVAGMIPRIPSPVYR